MFQVESKSVCVRARVCVCVCARGGSMLGEVHTWYGGCSARPITSSQPVLWPARAVPARL